MKIENIIYETTRSIYSVEDKLRIATIFLFCYKKSSKLFAELLYTNDHSKFLIDIEKKYESFGVDFSIRLSDKNVRECFYSTLEKVKEKYDDTGYHKALFENDPFALVIDEIVNYNFDAVEFKKFTKGIEKQLSLLND
jgi:phosphatidylglycerophosphatase A